MCEDELLYVGRAPIACMRVNSYTVHREGCVTVGVVNVPLTNVYCHLLATL